MSKMNCVIRGWFFLLATLTGAPWVFCQASQGHILTLPAGKDSVVRFFYQPPDNEYFHVARVFKVVEGKDPRLNTAPVLDTGRTMYISISEMQRLMARLSDLRLSWRESEKVEPLETYKTIHYHHGMSVKVFSPRGTAEAIVPPDKICETLAQLDAALQTPRALWEFQFFRVQYHCQVPNFNFQAYPDRIP